MRGVRRVAMLAGALLVSAPGITAAQASPGQGSLVLSGRGPAFVDVTLSRSVATAPMHLAGMDEDGWAWTGCGAVRGFYLRPLTGDPLAGAGAVDLADLRYEAADPALPGGPIPRMPVRLGTASVLRPGRYRAFLLGQGPCEVRVPLAGYGRTVRVTATRAATMAAQVQSDPVAAGAPLTRAIVTKVPVTVRAGTYAFALLHRVGYQVAGSTTTYSTCVEADTGERCAATPLTPETTRHGEYHSSSHPQSPPSTPLPVSSDTSDVGTSYAPGWLPTGQLYAKVSAVSTQTTALQAVTFALDL